MKKDFLKISDFSADELRDMLDLAIEVKQMTKEGKCPQPFKGKTFGMIFHKPSLRTRLSFETGVYQLGGYSLFITDREIELGKREAISDVARVMSRYLEGIVIRTFSQKNVEELARWATVPIINALTDLHHPCQIMGDIMTLMEHKGTYQNKNVTYLGDGNNIANSWLDSALRLPINITIACAEDTLPDIDLFRYVQKQGVGKVRIVHDPIEGVKGADVVYGDVWASMGQKDKFEEKAKSLQKFQINDKLLKHANKDGIVMHCLPAERGREITDEVMDGTQSVVFDQAENRLHIQKAILMKLIK
jgi:ornithine carbamoyltransferase